MVCAWSDFINEVLPGFFLPLSPLCILCSQTQKTQHVQFVSFLHPPSIFLILSARCMQYKGQLRIRMQDFKSDIICFRTAGRSYLAISRSLCLLICFCCWNFRETSSTLCLMVSSSSATFFASWYSCVRIAFPLIRSSISA